MDWLTASTAEVAELREHQHDRERHTEVTDTVDDECLLGGRGSRVLVLPEADQQVGRQADAFPAEEHHEVVGCEHQREHRGYEEIEEREEPAAPLIVLHVADRVDVDQRADTRDQQDEQPGQLVERERHVDVEAPRIDPGEQRGRVRTIILGLAEELREQDHAENEGRGRSQRADDVAETVGFLAPRQEDRRTRERDGNQEPLKVEHRGRP